MRITGMDEDLVVLLVPVVETTPVERDMVGELGGSGRRGGQPPADVFDSPVANVKIVERACAQDMMRLRSIGRLEQIRPDIAEGKVVDGQADGRRKHVL